MDPYELPFALLALLGWVLVLPAMMYWVGQADGMPIEVRFLVAFVVPAAALLTVTSWVQPG